MKEFKFDETPIPENFTKSLLTKGLDFPTPHTFKIGAVILDATARCLGSIKSKEKPQAVVFRQMNNNFICAGVVEWVERGEDDPDKLDGSWSFTWTFEESDLKNCNCVNASDSLVVPFFEMVATKTFSFAFQNNSTMTTIITFLEMLITFMRDTSNSSGDDVRIELPSFFVALCEKVDGEFKLGLEPNATVTALIKGGGDFNNNL